MDLMTTQATPKSDTFIVPRGDDRYYVYEPLSRAVAVVNGAAARAVAKHLEGNDVPCTPSERSVIDALREQGMLVPSTNTPAFPQGCDFFPHEVTLFLTSRCNLRCRYCYAEAGTRDLNMPPDIAEAAIDLVAANAGLLGSPVFGVGFHGGGEPTVAWNLFQHCVRYAEAKAETMGLDADIFAATNGVLSDEKRSFIIEHCKTVNVSLDGPHDIQDLNRPKASGAGSYADVHDTLKCFDAAGFHYGIRATITAATVNRMEEIVERLRDEFNFAYLHIEPVWACGRCTASGERPPPDGVFERNFVKASARAKALGIDIHYSGARLDVLTTKFCGAPGDGFSVLPEGIATSCYEITDPGAPLASVFHYGHYDQNARTFIFNAERLRMLREMSVEHFPYCSDCFCKWHCAGDCLAKVFRASRSTRHEGSQRCALNRALTLAALDDVVGSVHNLPSQTKPGDSG